MKPPRQLCANPPRSLERRICRRTRKLTGTEWVFCVATNGALQHDLTKASVALGGDQETQLLTETLRENHPAEPFAGSLGCTTASLVECSPVHPERMRGAPSSPEVDTLYRGRRAAGSEAEAIRAATWLIVDAFVADLDIDAYKSKSGNDRRIYFVAPGSPKLFLR